MLAPRIEGAVFVDAYAGTGAVGIEALSRGARRAIFVERSTGGGRSLIRENLAALGLEARARGLHQQSSGGAGAREADIVFLDPPYEAAKEYELAMVALETSGSGLVVVQHSSHATLPEECGHLRRYRVLKQGDNSLSFYERTT